MSSKALFDVPPGAVAEVSIIDSTLELSKMLLEHLVTPGLDGLHYFPTVTTWSFLVKSSTGETALFDLGAAPDVNASYSPAVVRRLKEFGWGIKAEKHVADTIRENGVDPASVGSVIWSHWHWDHLGDITTFPASTDLVVGPGFKEAFYPGYPTLPNSPVREVDFKDRNLREIDFSQQNPPLQAGAFRAFDFFGDGSFYLLDTPGHAVGHLSGLARTTTNPDTFIFMGGDLCHHGAEIRPSAHLPIPAQVQFPIPDALRARVSACPGGAVFEELNVKRGRKPDEPFFDPSVGADIPRAIQTIKEAQSADAQEDVFFVFAHDMSIVGSVEFFPEVANGWKEKGWREKTMWKFLTDLTAAVVPAQ